MTGVSEFTLDPTLAKDTIPVGEFDLCRVLLMKDANYPWLILVPQRDGIIEITDLSPDDQHLLMEEIATASKVLQAETGAYKMNVAGLGNQVRQLHVHVIARFETDAAWPKPVWGAAPAKPYEASEMETLKTKIANALKKNT